VLQPLRLRVEGLGQVGQLRGVVGDGRGREAERVHRVGAEHGHHVARQRGGVAALLDLVDDGQRQRRRLLREQRKDGVHGRQRSSQLRESCRVRRFHAVVEALHLGLLLVLGARAHVDKALEGRLEHVGRGHDHLGGGDRLLGEVHLLVPHQHAVAQRRPRLQRVVPRREHGERHDHHRLVCDRVGALVVHARNREDGGDRLAQPQIVHGQERALALSPGHLVIPEREALHRHDLVRVQLSAHAIGVLHLDDAAQVLLEARHHGLGLRTQLLVHLGPLFLPHHPPLCFWAGPQGARSRYGLAWLQTCDL